MALSLDESKSANLVSHPRSVRVGVYERSPQDEYITAKKRFVLATYTKLAGFASGPDA